MQPVFSTPSGSSWLTALTNWWTSMVSSSPFGQLFTPIASNIVQSEQHYWEGMQQVHIATQTQAPRIFANPWAGYAAKYQPQQSNGPAGNTYG